MDPTAAPPPGGTALEVWRRDRLPQLTLASRLAAAAGTEPEADLLTRAYVLVLAAEFQGFFSHLLSEVARTLVDSLPSEVPPPIRHVLQHAMERDRMVDFRNPDSTTLRRDLFRFDMDARTLLAAVDRDGRSLLKRLDQVIGIRNKLAHGAGSVSELGPGGERLAPAAVDEWCRDLDRLATVLDNAVTFHLTGNLSISG